jgi:hypothetical protein
LNEPDSPRLNLSHCEVSVVPHGASWIAAD